MVAESREYLLQQKVIRLSEEHATAEPLRQTEIENELKKLGYLPGLPRP